MKPAAAEYTLDGVPVEGGIDGLINDNKDDPFTDGEIARMRALRPGESMILGGGAGGEFTLARRLGVQDLMTGWPELQSWDADVAKHWLLRAMAVIGDGFHPDTAGRAYIKTDGSRLFSMSEEARFERMMGMVFGLVPDPYAVCLDAKARDRS